MGGKPFPFDDFKEEVEVRDVSVASTFPLGGEGWASEPEIISLSYRE
jgi:hypothetical protein